MSIKSSNDFFQILVFVESFYCINRYYLIKNVYNGFLCYVIFLLSSFGVFGAVFYYNVVIGEEKSIIKSLLQLISGVELMFLALEARKRKTFEAIQLLDEKCGVDKEFAFKMRAKVNRCARITFISGLLNFYVSMSQENNISLILLFGISMTAHDTEMDMIRLLIEGFNMRLELLKDSNPFIGSKVYRHVLMTAAHMGEEFNVRILVMFAVTLLKTVVYTIITLLLDTDSLALALLIWRQIRSVSSMWLLCLASQNTKSTCDSLALHLARRLTLDPSIRKDTNKVQYDTTRRWYNSVLRERPRYMTGSVESIDLTIPFTLFDVSINYLLIVVQVYAAYK